MNHQRQKTNIYKLNILNLEYSHTIWLKSYGEKSSDSQSHHNYQLFWDDLHANILIFRTHAHTTYIYIYICRHTHTLHI